MTRHRRTARACTLGAGAFTATGLYSATAGPWCAVPALYAAAFFAWCAARYYAAHHRAVAEAGWARARALGEAPAPLNPCCMLARHNDGTRHDQRTCTDEFHRIVTAHLDTDHNHAPRSST